MDKILSQRTDGDTISRRAAIIALADYLYKVCLALNSDMTEDESKECATLILQSVPSATQPNTANTVVTCESCRYSEGEPISDGRLWCDYLKTYMRYCSEGVRREDGDNDG